MSRRTHAHRPWRRRLTGLELLETRLALAALPAGFSEVPLATGLRNPTAMAIAPDGRIFIAEQNGDLRVVKNGVLLDDEFLHVSVNSAGERGLLGVAFDPNFATNNFVYVYYTTSTSPIHNRVSRFTANGDIVIPGSERVLLNLDNLSAATNHNGGAIHFGRDGKLYIGVGENADGDNAQTLGNLLGKILRINRNGSIPADNPFVDVPGARGEIWALGLRNPFTFAVQPGTGRIFVNDVGENTWEEINNLAKGANYGWPDTEGPTNDPRFVAPIFAYQHDEGQPQGQAIVGGAFYNPATPQFPSDFTGDYFFADLVGGWIWRYDVASDSAQEFATGIAAPVDLQVSDSGELYYLSRGFEPTQGALHAVRFGNAPPDVELFADRTYVENAPPIPIAPTATVTDADSANFGGGRLTVRITNNAQATDRLTLRSTANITISRNEIFVGGELVGTFSGGAGSTPLVVSFNARATVPRVQALLRNVIYRNVSEDPSANARRVWVRVTDGDGGASAPESLLINVVPRNDAPTLAPANGGSVGYQQNAGAVALLNNAIVTDVDHPNFAGGRLFVRVASGAHSSNRLLVGGPFTLAGNNIQLNGQTVATKNTEGGIGTNQLLITFNANATLDVVQQLVRAIRFRTVNGTSLAQRVIEFSLTDPTGAASNAATKTVNVTN